MKMKHGVMKKCLSLLVALCMLLTLVPMAALAAPAALVESGTIGDSAPWDGSAPWRLYDDGTLTVGAGTINRVVDTPWHNPWFAHSADITEIVFTGPIAAGSNLRALFANLTNLVTIKGLEHFGASAVTTTSHIFTGTYSLREFTLGEGFRLHADAGLPAPPANENFTGFWQNVGEGTVDDPQGEHVLTSAQLLALYNGVDGISDTWVWERHPVVSEGDILFRELRGASEWFYQIGADTRDPVVYPADLGHFGTSGADAVTFDEETRTFTVNVSYFADRVAVDIAGFLGAEREAFTLMAGVSGGTLADFTDEVWVYETVDAGWGTGHMPAYLVVNAPAAGTDRVLDFLVNGIPFSVEIIRENPPVVLTLTSVTVNDANLTREVTVGGTETGAIELDYDEADLPDGVEVELVGSEIVVTGERPAFGEAAINTTFEVEVTRGEETVILTVHVNLTPLPSLTLTPDEVEINDEYLTRTVTVGGTAENEITLDYTAPTGVTVAVEGNVITVTGIRPAHTGTAIDTEFDVTVTRGGVSETLTVIVDLTPLPAPVTGVVGDTDPWEDNGAPWTLYADGTLVVGPGTIHRVADTPWQSPWVAHSADITEIVFTGPITAGSNLRALFANLPNLVTIEGLEYFDTSAVTMTGHMFTGATSLRELTLEEAFRLHADAGLPTPPTNAYFTGYWQNVGEGTVNSPQGEHVLTSAQLLALYNGVDGISDTWVWQRAPLTVTYQSGLGTGNDHVVTVQYGDTHTVLATAPAGFTAPAGYRFNGWTLGDAVAPATIEITGNVVLVARWEPLPTYTVTFAPGVNGTLPTGTPNTITVPYGTVLTAAQVPTPIPNAGWNFTAWSSNPVDHVVTGNITFTAQYAPVMRTVTFAPGANGTLAGTLTIEVAHGTELTAAQVPTVTANTGWEFTEWSSNPVGHAVVANITFTAQYAQVMRTVTYQSGAGEGADHVVDVQYGTTHTILTAAPAGFTAPAGYRFNGWMRGTAVATGTVEVTENVVLVAQWEEIPTHTVTYQSGVGEGADHVVEALYGTTHTILTAAPAGFTAPAGYRFNGWTREGVAATGTITITGDVVLVAVWQLIPTYPVTFAAGLGSGTMANQIATEGVPFVLPASTFIAPETPPGRIFVGWLVSGGTEQAGQTLAASATINVTGPVTLTAQWSAGEVVTHTVTFAANGGGGTMADMTAAVGTPFTLPLNTFTAPADRVFAGWLVSGGATQAGQTLAEGATINVTGAVTLTAQWGIEADVLFLWNYAVAADKDEVFYENTVILGRTLTEPTLGEPERDGYTFEGWYLEPANERAKGFTTPVTEALLCDDEGHLRLYARWEEEPGFDFHAWFMQGIGANQFNPRGEITRGDVAAILVRTFAEGSNLAAPPAMPFTDVNAADHWEAAYIAWAYYHDFIRGNVDAAGNRIFRPREHVTREELVAMVVRAAELSTAGAGTVDFPDAGEITEWAPPYVYVAVREGWLRGDGAGRLRPTDDIERAEAAAVIARALGRYGSVNTASLEDVVTDIRLFQDVVPGDWFFHLVIEVSHSHYFVTENVGTEAAPRYMERWVEITWPIRVP
ncbi:MAG: InlB B-repeat-containing protein [Oscillospiraceae bacterium]|nr:InlB B-repeat-containing protein [Oscillospiraceae bacterium]